MTQETKDQENQEQFPKEANPQKEAQNTVSPVSASGQEETETSSEKQEEKEPRGDQDASEEQKQQEDSQPAEAQKKEKETAADSTTTEEETEIEDQASQKPSADSEEETPQTKEQQTESSEKTTGQGQENSNDDNEREFYDFGEDTGKGDDDEDDEKDAESGESPKETELPDYDSMERQQLVEELEKIVNKEDILEHKRKIALIKVAYLKKTDIEKTKDLEKRDLDKEEQENKKQETTEETKSEQETAVTSEASESETEAQEKKPGKDELEERFHKAFSRYKEKRAEHIKEQERIQQENLKKKEAILEELRELINSEETLKKTYDDFKALQEKWKEIGMVPKANVNELWKNYHFLVEKFFDKVKINKELRDLDMKKNLEQKIDICEKAEELLLEPSVNKSFKELQVLHDKYGQIGPVPGDKKEEVWNRFKSATEKIHTRRREHYRNLEQQQEKNLEAKTALCEKIENILTKEFKTVKEWNKATDEVKELMKLWRSIGFVPKKYNESIWNRFKTSVDTFFDNKKEFFKAIKEEQRDNYNRKLNLCLEAEALQDSTDWKKTTRDLINLQKEWKKIGPVSRKHSDKLWKRFRAANDKFFNAKEEYFKNIKEKEKENLKKKEDLIERIQNQEFGEDKNENLKILKEYQREWMNIGFVPFEKKDEIQKRYQDIINKHMESLSISNTEVNSAKYKTHVENMKDIPGGERKLKKERANLISKINKLKEDVKLWENNTGFLANSKNAEVLKKEFQEKIDKAKREIALLEAQINILDNEKE